MWSTKSRVSQHSFTTWLVDDDFDPVKSEMTGNKNDKQLKAEDGIKEEKKLRKKQTLSFHTRVYEKLIKDRQKNVTSSSNVPSNKKTTSSTRNTCSADFSSSDESDYHPSSHVTRVKHKHSSKSYQRKAKKKTVAKVQCIEHFRPVDQPNSINNLSTTTHTPISNEKNLCKGNNIASNKCQEAIIKTQSQHVDDNDYKRCEHFLKGVNLNKHNNRSVYRGANGDKTKWKGTKSSSMSEQQPHARGDYDNFFHTEETRISITDKYPQYIDKENDDNKCNMGQQYTHKESDAIKSKVGDSYNDYDNAFMYTDQRLCDARSDHRNQGSIIREGVFSTGEGACTSVYDQLQNKANCYDYETDLYRAKPVRVVNPSALPASTTTSATTSALHNMRCAGAINMKQSSSDTAAAAAVKETDWLREDEEERREDGGKIAINRSHQQQQPESHRVVMHHFVANNFSASTSPQSPLPAYPATPQHLHHHYMDSSTNRGDANVEKKQTFLSVDSSNNKPICAENNVNQGGRRVAPVSSTCSSSSSPASSSATSADAASASVTKAGKSNKSICHKIKSTDSDQYLNATLANPLISETGNNINNKLSLSIFDPQWNITIQPHKQSVPQTQGGGGRRPERMTDINLSGDSSKSPTQVQHVTLHGTDTRELELQRGVPSSAPTLSPFMKDSSRLFKAVPLSSGTLNPIPTAADTAQVRCTSHGFKSDTGKGATVMQQQLQLPPKLSEHRLHQDCNDSRMHKQIAGCTDREEKHAVFLTERMEDYFVYKRNRKPWQQHSLSPPPASNIHETSVPIPASLSLASAPSSSSTALQRNKKQTPENLYEQYIGHLAKASKASAVGNLELDSYSRFDKAGKSRFSQSEPVLVSVSASSPRQTFAQKQQPMVESITEKSKKQSINSSNNTRQWKTYLTDLPIDPSEDDTSLRKDVSKSNNNNNSNKSDRMSASKQQQNYHLYLSKQTKSLQPDNKETINNPVSVTAPKAEQQQVMRSSAFEPRGHSVEANLQSKKDMKLANLELHTKALMEEERRKYNEYKKAYDKQHVTDVPTNVNKTSEAVVQSPITSPSPISSPLSNEQVPNLMFRRVHHERQKAIIDESEVDSKPIGHVYSSNVQDQSRSGNVDLNRYAKQPNVKMDSNSSNKDIYSKSGKMKIPSSQIRSEEPRRSAFQYVGKQASLPETFTGYDGKPYSNQSGSSNWNYNNVYKQPDYLGHKPMYSFADLEMEITRRKRRPHNVHEVEYRKSMDENMLNRRVQDPTLFFQEDTRVRRSSGSDDNVKHKPPIAPCGVPLLTPIRLSRSTQSLSPLKSNLLSRSDERLNYDDRDSVYWNIPESNRDLQWTSLRDDFSVKANKDNTRSMIDQDQHASDQKFGFVFRPIPNRASKTTKTGNEDPKLMDNFSELSRQRVMLNDNLAELERMYANLNIDTDDCADPADFHNYLNDKNRMIRRLSAENLRIHDLSEQQRKISGSPSQEYTKKWLESKSTNFKSPLPLSDNVMDDDVFIAVGPDDKPCCSQLFVNNLSSPQSPKPSLGEKISNKYNLPRSSAEIKQYLMTGERKDECLLGVPSYKEPLRVKTISTVSDPSSKIRLVGHNLSTLPQNKQCLAKEANIKKPANNDRIDQDLYMNRSVKARSINDKNKNVTQPLMMWRTQRARSLPLEDDMIDRRRHKSDTESLSQRNEQVRPRRHNLSRGIAAMVEKICSDDKKTQSLPDLTDQSVFSSNYDPSGELITEDPKHFENADKHRKVPAVAQKNQISTLQVTRCDQNRSDSEGYVTGGDVPCMTTIEGSLDTAKTKPQKCHVPTDLKLVDVTNQMIFSDTSIDSRKPQIISYGGQTPIIVKSNVHDQNNTKHGNQDFKKKYSDKNIHLTIPVPQRGDVNEPSISDCEVEVLSLDEVPSSNTSSGKKPTLTVLKNVPDTNKQHSLSSGKQHHISLYSVPRNNRTTKMNDLSPSDYPERRISNFNIRSNEYLINNERHGHETKTPANNAIENSVAYRNNPKRLEPNFSVFNHGSNNLNVIINSPSREDFEISVPSPIESLPRAVHVKEIPQVVASTEKESRNKEKHERAMERLDLIVKQQSVAKEVMSERPSSLTLFSHPRQDEKIAPQLSGKSTQHGKNDPYGIYVDNDKQDTYSKYPSKVLNKTKMPLKVSTVKSTKPEIKSPNLLQVMHHNLSKKRANQKAPQINANALPHMSNLLTNDPAMDDFADDASDVTIVPDDVSDVLSLADLAAEQPMHTTDDDLDSDNEGANLSDNSAIERETSKIMSLSVPQNVPKIMMRRGSLNILTTRANREPSPEEGVSTKALPFKDLLKAFEGLGSPSRRCALKDDSGFSMRKCISTENIGKVESPPTSRIREQSLRKSSGSDTQLNRSPEHRSRLSTGQVLRRSDMRLNTEKQTIAASPKSSGRVRIKTVVEPKNKK